MDQPAMKAGVIGLGAMGAPMARRLAAAGRLAALWNRTPARAAALAAELGVPVAADPAALASACDVVVVSVAADADVREVIAALLPAARAGLTVVDTSTVAAATARELAARLAERGADFLDAPVTGGVEGARHGTLTMMVGGEAAVLARVEPLLQALAARVVHFGPVGSGQAAKAVNQIMAAGIAQAVTEALAFGEAMNLPMDKLIEAVGSGAVGNWFLSHRGASMVAGSFKPGFRLALHHKDLKICQAMAQALGASLPVVEMTLLHYRRLMDAGFGDEDISALLRAKRQLFRKEAQ
jgi:3-hydroxyisobutyrate dehydrogenase